MFTAMAIKQQALTASKYIETANITHVHCSVTGHSKQELLVLVTL